MHYLKPTRRKKSWKQKDFSPHIKQSVLERDRVCQVCHRNTPPFDIQHIFSRGKLYRDTVNWIENAALVCRSCHHRLTHATNAKDREADRKLHELALERFSANSQTPPEDIQEMRSLFNARFNPVCTCGYDRALQYVDAAVHSEHCETQKTPL